MKRIIPIITISLCQHGMYIYGNIYGTCMYYSSSEYERAKHHLEIVCLSVKCTFCVFIGKHYEIKLVHGEGGST